MIKLETTRSTLRFAGSRLREMPPSLISRFLIVSLLGALCGCGSSNDSGPTVTGVVLMGDETAVANLVGADGLTPVPSGTRVEILYDDGLKISHANSPAVDAQGHFTFHLQGGTSREYHVDIANTCSTAAGVELGPGGQISVTNDPSFTNGHTPSTAMARKAISAADALGVNVAIIIGTDSDSCAR